MPHVRGLALPREYEGWSGPAGDGQETGGGQASSPVAVPGFFLGWIAIVILLTLSWRVVTIPGR